MALPTVEGCCSGSFQHYSLRQTSGYTLTVVASDNGVPPLSGSSMINIDISDVNDNPPLFSQANYSLIIQVKVGVRADC